MDAYVDENERGSLMDNISYIRKSGDLHTAPGNNTTSLSSFN